MLPAAGTFYSAFCDPACGSGQDSFTCAVAHKKSDGEIIIDAVREVRPFFSPSAVIDDLVILLKSYRIWQINGDHFAGEFPRELFRKHGICYEVCKSPKSSIRGAHSEGVISGWRQCAERLRPADRTRSAWCRTRCTPPRAPFRARRQAHARTAR